MKIIIDTAEQTLVCEELSGRQTLALYSEEAFDVLSRQWIRVGWNQRYSYSFSWMGHPIIQLPEDILRIQEVICRVKPDVIVETGVAHGGSLIFYASLCELINRGRVIGIDVEIRAPNRAAIEADPLARRITLIEGSSIAPETVASVRSLVKAGENALVILDSNHSKDHVLRELEAYHPLVPPGSYIVATDGIMADLFDVPRGKPGWREDNPATAAREFAARHPEFVIEQPGRLFAEIGGLTRNVTYWPGAFLKRW